MKLYGLEDDFAFSLISCATVLDSKGNYVNLIKLKNPWGIFEWLGEWDNTSALWTN